MNDLGYLCLILIIIVCFAGLGLAFASFTTRRRELIRGAVGAVYVVAALAVIASIALLVLLVTRDFANDYVYGHVSRALPFAYTVSAFWAGNAGSLLLWLLLMSIFSLVAVRQIRREDHPSSPYTVTILLAITTFFGLLMVFGSNSNPFIPVPGGVVPADGIGLNPQLENPGMVIHPVALYLGFVGCAIPFAVVMGGLIARSPSIAWLPTVRRWSIVAWFFLGIGNLVGAWWAYVTLGWGGYWAWDPVENASLMPWLTITAVVHSVVMLRRRRMFSLWTAILVSVTFLLTIFGTFLTRSGVASSVHAFSDNSYIPWFTIFMLLVIALAAAVMVSRRSELRSPRKLDDPLSRESSFLYTNVVLVVVAFVVLWGVVFPTVAGAIRGTDMGLDANFFTVVTVPLTLILMFLMGFCPLLPWRGRDRERLLRDAIYTAVPAVIVLVVLLALGARSPYTVISFTLATFAAASIALQYGRGWRNRHKASGKGWVRAFGGMLWSNRSRYGGFLVHLGVILVLVGITGSNAFKQEFAGDITQGESLEVGRYELTYDGLTFEEEPDKDVARAAFTVSRDGKVLGQLDPVREYYPSFDQVWTRVAIRSTLVEDLYVSLVGFTDDGNGVSLEAEINPLVIWLWIGGGVLVVGGLITLWPQRWGGDGRRQSQQKATASMSSSKNNSADAQADT